MARSLQYPDGQRVFVDERGGRVPGIVRKDTGIGLVDVEIESTGQIRACFFKDLSIRRGAAQPPPGAGGRDVAPLRFPEGGVEPASPPSELRAAMRAEARPAVMAQLAAVPKQSPPHRDEDHKAWVRTLSCAVPWCRKAGPSECAHARGPRGVSQKVDDHRTFPACSSCHQELHTKATLGKLDVAATRELEHEMVIATQGQRLRWLGARLAELRRHNAALLERARPDGSH